VFSFPSKQLGEQYTYECVLSWWSKTSPQPPAWRLKTAFCPGSFWYRLPVLSEADQMKHLDERCSRALSFRFRRCGYRRTARYGYGGGLCGVRKVRSLPLRVFLPRQNLGGLDYPWCVSALVPLKPRRHWSDPFVLFMGCCSEEMKTTFHNSQQKTKERSAEQFCASKIENAGAQCVLQWLCLLWEKTNERTSELRKVSPFILIKILFYQTKIKRNQNSPTWTITILSFIHAGKLIKLFLKKHG